MKSSTKLMVVCMQFVFLCGSTTAQQSGHAVTCTNDVNSYRVYRFFEGSPNEIRWYPNQEIADSWDDNWERWKKAIDCQGFQHGPDMVKAPAEGQAVKCQHDPHPHKVYRFSKHGLRWYPNEAIASSWDAQWGQFVTIDCGVIHEGQNMEYRRQRSSWKFKYVH